MNRRRILKVLRGMLFFLVCLVTLLALIVAEENLRGKIAWEHCRRDLEAQGEHLDLAWLIPPPIPDEQNFAMTPLLKKAFREQETAKIDDPRRKQVLDKISLCAGGGYTSTKLKGAGWQTGNSRDLEAWQSYYRKVFPELALSRSTEVDIITAIGGIDGVFAEIRKAAKTRPLSRYPIRYENGVGANLPHYSLLHQLVHILSIRATAELRLNRSNEAFEDIQLAFHLVDSTRGEPFLISGLVHIAEMSLLTGPLWEGIALHRWTDGQLASFQTELDRVDFLSDYLLGIRFERIMFQDIVTKVVKDPPLMGRVNDSSLSKCDAVLLRCMKILPGWGDQNLVVVSRRLQESLSCVDQRTQRVYLQRALRDEEVLKKEKWTPYTFLAKIFIPSFSQVWRKFPISQAFANEAIIACAIERYRLAHGALPAALNDLKVAGLPHDVMNGEPLHYRVTGNDTYRLYSVGCDGKDAGGTVVKKDNDTIDLTQGDLVWSLQPL